MARNWAAHWGTDARCTASATASASRKSFLTALINANNVERVLANIDANYMITVSDL
jgi:hypothetical protein